MKKIPDEIDNPIDNLLIQFADYLCPFFKQMGHTPNMITTYSLITGVLSVYFLYKGYPFVFALLYMISYFFDCMDGHYARKYQMTSREGDLYDHIKDISVYIILIYVVYIKYRKVIKPIDLIVLITTLFLCMVHIGCQQKYLQKENDDETLDLTKHLCSSQDMIHYTKWVGMGTFIVISILLILLIHQRCANFIKERTGL